MIKLPVCKSACIIHHSHDFLGQDSRWPPSHFLLPWPRPDHWSALPWAWMVKPLELSDHGVILLAVKIQPLFYEWGWGTVRVCRSSGHRLPWTAVGGILSFWGLRFAQWRDACSFLLFSCWALTWAHETDPEPSSAGPHFLPLPEMRASPLPHVTLAHFCMCLRPVLTPLFCSLPGIPWTEGTSSRGTLTRPTLLWLYYSLV